MFDLIDRGSALQGLATIPVFIWELSFGIYLIVKGFKTVRRPQPGCVARRRITRRVLGGSPGQKPGLPQNTGQPHR